MAVYDILPSTDLWGEDIRDTLEAGGANFSDDYNANNYRDNCLNFFKKYANINKSSLYKPIPFKKDFDLTEQDYLDANFGYNILNYNSFSRLKQAISNNEKWEYYLPDGTANEPLRMGDFRKYQYRANSPFEIKIEGPYEQGEFVHCLFPTELIWLSLWKEWSPFQGADIQYLNVGFYVPRVGYYPLTDTNQGMSIPDLDSEKLNFELTASVFLPGSTYQVYLILTTWDGLNGARKWYYPSDSESGIWWFFPQETVKSFTVSKPKTPLDYLIFEISDDYCSVRTDSATADTIISNVNFKCTAGLDSAYAGSAGEFIINFYVDSVYPGHGTQVETKDIGSMYSKSLKGGQTISEAQYYGSNLRFLTDRDHLTVRADISFSIGLRLYKETRNFGIFPEQN